MIKAVIMDMDGTLLDPNNKISPATKEKLIELEKKGVRLILASGRSYTRLLPYARELEMEKYGGLLIEVDGIAWYDLAKRTPHTQTDETGGNLFDLSIFDEFELRIDGMF